MAITSVLINMFFLIAVITYNTTNKFDESIYKKAVAEFCDQDYENVSSADTGVFVDDVPILPSESYAIECRTAEFEPYYNQAVEDYLKDLGY